MKTLKKLLAVILALALTMGMIIPMALAEEEEVDETLIPASSQPVECQRDGQTMRGTLQLPAHHEGDKLPIVILNHGFMSSQRELSGLAGQLANAGYASVRFDFMGSGQSDGTFLDVTWKTEVEDLHYIIDYVKTLDFVDQNFVFLQGNSYGGMVASMVAPDRAADIRALCLWFPALNAGDDARDGHIQDSVFDVDNLPDTLRVQRSYVSKQFLKDQLELDPYEPASKYEGDVLILHGTADFLVPYASSEKMVSMYKHGMLKGVEGASHGFYGPNLNTGAAMMIEFLNEQMNAVIGTETTVKAGEDETASIDVIYNGAEPLSSITVQIGSELEVKEVTCDSDFEFNPANGKVIVYNGQFNKGDTLFSISFDVDPEQKVTVSYRIDLDVLAATAENAELTEVSGGYGYVTIKGNYPLGDVDMDGELTNADIIMIARYLVDLEYFNRDQKALADFNQDGMINNTDLVLIARAIAQL